MMRMSQDSFSRNQKTLANLLTNKGLFRIFVAPAGIEPASQAPETCILSIVLRSPFFFGAAR